MDPPPPDFSARSRSALPEVSGGNLWTLTPHEKKLAGILLRGSMGADPQERIQAFDAAKSYLQGLSTGELVDLLMLYTRSLSSGGGGTTGALMSGATLQNPQNLTDFRSLVASLIESEIRREDLESALEAVRLSRGIVQRNWVAYVEGRIDPALLSRTRDAFRDGLGNLETFRAGLKNASLRTEDARKVQQILERSLDRVVFGRTGPSGVSLGDWLGRFQSRLGGADPFVLRETLVALMSVKDLQLDAREAMRLLVNLRGVPGAQETLKHLQSLYGELQLDQLIADAFFSQRMVEGGLVSGLTQAVVGAAQGLSERRARYQQWVGTADRLYAFLRQKATRLPAELNSFEMIWDLLNGLEFEETPQGQRLKGKIGVGYDFNVPLLASEVGMLTGWVRELTGLSRQEMQGLRGLLQGFDGAELELVRRFYQEEVGKFIELFVVRELNGDASLAAAFKSHVLSATQERLWIHESELQHLGREFLQHNYREAARLSWAQEQWVRFVREESFALEKSVQARLWAVGLSGEASMSAGLQMRPQLEAQFKSRLDELIAKLNVDLKSLDANPELQKRIATLRRDLQSWRDRSFGAFSRSAEVFGEALRQDVVHASETARGVRAGLGDWLAERPSLEQIRADLRQEEAELLEILRAYPNGVSMVANTRQLYAFLRGEGGGASLLQLNSDLTSAVLGALGSDPERARLQELVVNSGWAGRVSESVQSIVGRAAGWATMNPSDAWKLEFMKKVDELARNGIAEIRKSMADLSESPLIALDFKPVEVFIRILIRYYYEFREDIDYRETLAKMAELEHHTTKDILGVVFATSGVGLQKLMQIMAKEPGIKAELQEVFEVLESDLDAIPFEVIDRRLREKIPQYYPSLFKSISRNGKRGTMAQTNLGEMRLPDGSYGTVALRTLIPEALESLVKDKLIFAKIGGVVENHPELKGIGANQIKAMLDSTFRSIDEEADPEITEQNIRDAKATLEGQRTVWTKIDGKRQEVILNFVVPGVHYPETAKQGVLIMQGVDRFSKFSTYYRDNRLMANISAEELVALSLDRALARGNGFFHGDLHGGNIGISTGPTPLRPVVAKTPNPYIINHFFFDLGMVGRLGETRAALFKLSLALMSSDVPNAVEAGQRILVTPLPPQDMEAAVRAALDWAKRDGEVADISYLAPELSVRGGIIQDQIMRLNRTTNTGRQFVQQAGSEKKMGDLLGARVTQGLLREAWSRFWNFVTGKSEADAPPMSRLPLTNAEFRGMIKQGVKDQCASIFNSKK